MAAKMTATVVPVLAAAVVWMFSTFETAQGADEKWAQHNQAIACRTVYELQAQIRSYLKELQLNPGLTDAQRQWIDREIENLREEIRRIDPNGAC